MLSEKEEYQTLRQELLELINSRSATQNLAITAAVGLLAAGVQFHTPYFPLFAAFLLHYARLQIFENNVGIQRLATYIRIMLEEGNNKLNWETGSYASRHSPIEKRKPILRFIPLSLSDRIISGFGFGAISLSIVLSLLPDQQPIPFYVTFFRLPPISLSLYICATISFVWLVLWLRWRKRILELERLELEEKEERFWRDFKKSIEKRKKLRST